MEGTLLLTWGAVAFVGGFFGWHLRGIRERIRRSGKL